MSEEIHKIEQSSPWYNIEQNDSHCIGSINQPETIKFYIGDKECLEITRDGFYVEGRLVANDIEIYGAFKGFLSGRTKPETQDDRYYKAIRRHIEKEESNGDE